MKGLMKKKARKKRRKLNKRDSKPDTSLDQIPDDVLMDILWRLPVDSLLILKCVSKLWYSLITSRYVTNTFYKTQVSLRRRFMYLIDKEGNSALLSTSPLNKLEQCCILTQDLTIQGGTRGFLVNALRGLMCFRTGTRVSVCNFTTTQHVELPLVKLSCFSIIEDSTTTMWNYFGYDHTRDEYKVLSIVSVYDKEERVVRSEHHVFVLGLGASWRNTRSLPPPPPHVPCSRGLSIDGVLYYGALNYDKTFFIVSFDLSSEEFTMMIQSPFVTTTMRANVMSYQGKVAIFDYSRLSIEHKLDLWVAGKNNNEWSDKKTFVLPMSNIRIILQGELLVESTGRMGEIILRNPRVDKKPVSVYIVYDLEKSKEVGAGGISAVQSNSFDTDSLHMTYWDDTMSIMYLQL
ncbi:unnamed protein product [Cochlearia groenlandica]